MGLLRRIRFISKELFFALFLLFGETFSLLKMYTFARRLYKFALQLWPDKKAQLLSELGSLYERSDDLETALQYYKEVCNLEPRDANSYVDLGCIYEKQNKDKLAIENYEKALEIGTDFGEDFRKEVQSRIVKLKQEVS